MPTPNFGFPFPGLSDIPNIPADLEALAEAVDTTLATYCHIEGGGGSLPASTSTTLTGYTSSYGQPWANLSTGIITVPVAGIYQLGMRAHVAPPASMPEDYDLNVGVRDASTSLISQWNMNLRSGLGASAHTAGCALHLPAGAALRASVYLAIYTSTASQAVLSVRLVEAD